MSKVETSEVVSRSNNLLEIMSMCKDDPAAILTCRNELIELNIRLVSTVLKKYSPYGEDEFQVGCVGLINAANTFNIERGVPFSSYACFCIERELHKAHAVKRDSFEYQASGYISSLDELISLENGDEMKMHETIADGLTEEKFERILLDFDLGHLFEDAILPAIEQVANKNGGQNTVIDFDTWRTLELRYILEMIEIDSQKARVTLSAVAKELGVSVQNVRMRHQRVIEAIKINCKNNGYEV